MPIVERKTALARAAPYVVVALIVAAAISKVGSLALIDNGDRLGGASAETVFRICLYAASALGAIGVLSNIYWIAVHRRNAIRTLLPEGVVFATYNRFEEKGQAGETRTWQPAGRRSFTIGVSVSPDGWTVWSGILRPRAALVIEGVRVRSVRVGTDIAGAPGLILSLVDPEEEFSLSLIGEHPSAFRPTEPTLAPELVGAIHRLTSQ